MAVWQDTADGHYCPKHDQAFKRLDTCTQCVSDNATENAPRAASDYDQRLAQRISSYQTRARKLRCLADGLYENADGDYHAFNTGAKLDAEATRLDRLAEERQEVLDNREHDLQLIRHEREMSGLRGSH